VWNTVATGKTPEEHGIVGFAWEAADGKRHLYSSLDRRSHALWNIATDSGRSVAVANWWNTYPTERVDGVMVSDHLIEDQVQDREHLHNATSGSSGPLVYPEAWRERLIQQFSESTPVIDFPDPFLGNAPLLEWVRAPVLSTSFREDGAFTRMTATLMRELRPDLTMVLLTGIDRVSHVLWGSIEPAKLYPPRLRPTPRQRRAAAEALYSYYEYSDRLVGEILAETGPQDLVLVLSDHGFEGHHSMGHLTGHHVTEAAIDGVLFARGPGITPGSSSDGTNILDITPSVLSWWGLPAARDMSGRVAPFLQRESTARIDTYDTAPIERIGSGPSGSDKQLLERLRALGYLEEEAAPHGSAGH
jgi:predicted AlkP superfamily phosphohydrolase/phosphomutase